MKKKKKFIKPVNVLLSDRMHIQLKIITDKYEINYSDFVRQSIKEKIEKEQIKDNKEI